MNLAMPYAGSIGVQTFSYATLTALCHEPDVFQFMTRQEQQRLSFLEGITTMMTKRRIALLIAGMLVGAQVGIASMSGPAETSEQQPEAPLQAEASEPTTSAEQTESQATAEQASAPEQQAEAAPAVPAKPRTLADAIFPALHSETFPPSTDERPLNPHVAAYLEARAANTLLADAGARSSPFPDAEEPGQRMLPTQFAYFERREAERLAAYEQRLQAERERAAVAAGTVDTRPVETAALPETERVAGTIQQ